MLSGMTADDRLERMKKSFNRDFSILAEDYEFFTHISTSPLGGATPQSKVQKTSDRPSEKPDQEPS